MTDIEITEAYFVARGWTWKDKVHLYLPEQPTEDKFCSKCGKTTPYRSEGWHGPDGEHYWELPPIIDHYPAFREHVLEVMREDGWKFLIEDGVFFWIRLLPESECSHNPRHTEDFGVDIKDNDLLKAGIIASTRYWEAKNDSNQS